MARTDFDQTRFITALTRHQPALEAFCHAQLANRQDAQEVLQATCVKLWEKGVDWDPETEFLPWAFAVARSRCFPTSATECGTGWSLTKMWCWRWRRRRRKRRLSSTIAAKLWAMHAKAYARQHSILHKHYFVGHTVREIAVATQRSESAIKMILLRLREQLSQCIQRQLNLSS